MGQRSTTQLPEKNSVKGFRPPKNSLKTSCGSWKWKSWKSLNAESSSLCEYPLPWWPVNPSLPYLSYISRFFSENCQVHLHLSSTSHRTLLVLHRYIQSCPIISGEIVCTIQAGGWSETDRQNSGLSYWQQLLIKMEKKAINIKLKLNGSLWNDHFNIWMK